MKAVKKNKTRCRMPSGQGKVLMSVSKGLCGNLSKEMVFEHNLGREKDGAMRVSGKRASWQLLSSPG